MTRRLILALSFAALITTSWLTAAPQLDAVGDKRLAAARHKAVDDGDLPGAIEMYREIVTTAGANRVLKAHAMFGMAECYERLGKPEALATYETIVKDFADVNAVSVAARAKVATQRSPGLVARQVWEQSGIGYYANEAAVSPDGRTLAFVDWNNGELGVLDLESRRERLLTTGGLQSETYAEDPKFSPDSRLIAYGMETDADKPYELRVIGRDGSQPRVLRSGSKPGIKLYVIGWHPSGKSVLATEGPDGGPPRKDLILVPLDGGEPRVLKKTFTNWQGEFVFSPDGKCLAYALRQSASEPDLYCLNPDTGEDKPMYVNPANDQFIDWFPDGKRILFRSDRRGSWAIWSAAFANGAVQGEPVFVQGYAGTFSPGGFTSSGDYYYSVHTRQAEVYLASIAAGSGLQTGTLSRLEGRFQGFKNSAVWSPIGDQLAYLQEPVTAASSPVTTLAIHTVATGQVRPISLSLRIAQNPVWAPDGKSIVVQGTDQQGLQGLFTVEIATGATTLMAGPDLVARVSARHRPAYSADGQQIFFSNPGGRDIDARILRRDISSGAEETVARETSQNFALSPNNEWLALTRYGRGPDLDVVLVPVKGGPSKTLTTFPAGWTNPFPVTWAADSRSIFVAKQGMGGPEVWRVELDGKTTFTGIRWSGSIQRISVHPDGKQLALSTMRSSSETFVLQNLPNAVR